MKTGIYTLDFYKSEDESWKNENDEVISAQDYDCWGYLLEDRTYESDESVHKFTGKERDEESEYDYFGARYYDARVGRWGAVDSLFSKHYDVIMKHRNSEIEDFVSNRPNDIVRELVNEAINLFFSVITLLSGQRRNASEPVVFYEPLVKDGKFVVAQ